MQFVDYTQLREEALSSVSTHIMQHDNESLSLVEQMWLTDARSNLMDLLCGCFDVACLVALGFARLGTTFSSALLATVVVALLLLKIEAEYHVVYERDHQQAQGMNLQPHLPDPLRLREER